MTYYKIISQEQIVGIGTMFLQWSKKYKRFYYSNINNANCVQDAITQKIYHTSWLIPLPSEATNIESATVITIDKQEYKDLYEQLKEDKTIPFIPPKPEPEPNPEPEPAELPEQPLTIQQMREKLKKQDETINMLVDCLLEVSEVVYNE